MGKNRNQGIPETQKNAENPEKNNKNEAEEKKIFENINFSEVLPKKAEGLTPEDISNGSIFSDVCNFCVSDYDFWYKYE